MSGSMHKRLSDVIAFVFLLFLGIAVWILWRAFDGGSEL